MGNTKAPESLARLCPVSEIHKIEATNFSKPVHFADEIKPAVPLSKAYVPCRPELISPAEKSQNEALIMKRIINLVVNTEQLEKDLMDMSIGQQEDLVKQLSVLAREELEKARHAEEAGKSASNWSYLTKIATCLFAAATMTIGWYLTGNPDVSSWVSYGMIGAGAMSVTSMALSEMNVWPNLMRVMGLGAGTLGLVLGGGPSFAFVASQLPDLMVKITLLGVNALYGMSTVGRSYRKSQMQWYMHEQFTARQKRRLIENFTTENAHNVERTIKQLDHINTSAFRLVDEWDRSRREMQRIGKSAA